MSEAPAIDYTNKDYRSLRQAMLDLARYRLPEWTDQSAADLGSLMVDLFAYVGDVTLYYQDRIANESFLHTAVERRSVLHLLRLLDYQLRPPTAASAELLLTFAAPAGGSSPLVTIPHGAQFATTSAPSQQMFEYLGPDLVVDLTSDQVEPASPGHVVYRGLPVRHSRRAGIEVLGSSTGEPNQAFRLSQGPLILESLVVEVNEGAGWVEWERRESLLYNLLADGRITFSAANARDYYVQFDENDAASVVFGDGLYGRLPAVGSNNVRATYRVGGGSVGNVPAGAITRAVTGISGLVSVTNPLPAAGGEDHESIEHAVRFGPLAYRSGQRAVTLSDYVALAHRAGGVAKVRARSRGWNEIELYVAPEGDSFRPVPEDLKRRLSAYFEDKRMVGTFVRILDAAGVPISLKADVLFDHHYLGDEVRQSVQSTMEELLAFANVDFGRPLYLSDVYAAIEGVPGVFAVTVTEFRRLDEPVRTLESELESHHLKGIDRLPPALLSRVVPAPPASPGRIEIGEFEIPVLEVLEVTMSEAPR